MSRKTKLPTPDDLSNDCRATAKGKMKKMKQF